MKVAILSCILMSFTLKVFFLLGMEAHAFNPNARETESGMSLGVWGQPNLTFWVSSPGAKELKCISWFKKKSNYKICVSFPLSRNHYQKRLHRPCPGFILMEVMIWLDGCSLYRENSDFCGEYGLEESNVQNPCRGCGSRNAHGVRDYCEFVLIIK